MYSALLFVALLAPEPIAAPKASASPIAAPTACATGQCGTQAGRRLFVGRTVVRSRPVLLRGRLRARFGGCG
jgi:hypothetical protein